jgi:hypothetical protein
MDLKLKNTIFKRIFQFKFSEQNYFYKRFVNSHFLKSYVTQKSHCLKGLWIQLLVIMTKHTLGKQCFIALAQSVGKKALVSLDGTKKLSSILGHHSPRGKIFTNASDK